jgi:hypothetical protein
LFGRRPRVRGVLGLRGGLRDRAGLDRSRLVAGRGGGRIGRGLVCPGRRLFGAGRGWGGLRIGLGSRGRSVVCGILSRGFVCWWYRCRGRSRGGSASGFPIRGTVFGRRCHIVSRGCYCVDRSFRGGRVFVLGPIVDSSCIVHRRVHESPPRFLEYLRLCPRDSSLFAGCT